MIRRRKFIIVLIIVLFFLITSFLLATRFRNSQSYKQKKIEDSDNLIVKEIGTQLNLPYTKPLIANVYNDSEFRNNGELTSLKRGDKVIVYVSSNDAVIYRPADKKIINVLSARALLETKF
jgi:preprotein translocase subunit YajC